MVELKGRFPSSSGLCDVHFYIFKPEKPKAALMLSHGMCEYIERYREFAEFLCGNDIALCGSDHIGHGKSVTDDNMLGYFGEEHGYFNMVRDLNRMKKIMDRELPDIPHFLMGHSMGSLLARIFIAKYPHDWHGVILCGTAGGFVSTLPIRRVVDSMVNRRTGRYRHQRATELALGLFNIRNENHRTPNDWLSRDEANVDRFCNDPKCNFIFTLAGYRDLMNALMTCNSDTVIGNTPTELPLFFLSGGMDPVGEYGQGVRSAVIKYLERGCEVSLKIYPEARHELIFELNRDEVMKNILDFIVRHC
ncbi:MAG: alpha/beta fold hydrolase [Oscillospiraceae bacterium]